MVAQSTGKTLYHQKRESRVYRVYRMGVGDWIMATADAKRANEKHGVRVQFGDGNKAYWDDVFLDNPRIAKTLEDGERFAWIPNFPGCRPYIKEVKDGRYIYQDEYRATPGELYIKRREKADYIIIEPNIKEMYWIGKNKDWGFQNWQKLVEMIEQPWIQLGEASKRKLNGKNFRQTDTFREAMEWVSGASLLITTDGGLHHAAAALGVPAIVLWGGMASPKNLGYETHTNIWHGDEPCGNFKGKCDHCIEAMKKITVKEVYEEYKRLVVA